MPEFRPRQDGVPAEGDSKHHNPLRSVIPEEKAEVKAEDERREGKVDKIRPVEVLAYHAMAGEYSTSLAEKFPWHVPYDRDRHDITGVPIRDVGMQGALGGYIYLLVKER